MCIRDRFQNHAVNLTSANLIDGAFVFQFAGAAVTTIVMIADVSLAAVTRRHGRTAATAENESGQRRRLPLPSGSRLGATAVSYTHLHLLFAGIVKYELNRSAGAAAGSPTVGIEPPADAGSPGSDKADLENAFRKLRGKSMLTTGKDQRSLRFIGIFNPAAKRRERSTKYHDCSP